MLIDSHSHIDGAEFQLDIDEVFARMKEAEVGGALVAGTSLQDYERGLNFANAHKNVWYAAGVHPSTKDDDHEASIEELVGLTKPQKVVAIGECGLDYYYEEEPYDAQLERFARHIEAAKLANLPVIVHSRDAQEDTIRLLKEHDAGSTGFVLHCFTGDKKMAQDALDLGGYLFFFGYRHVQERNSDSGSRVLGSERSISRRNRLSLPCSDSVPRKAQRTFLRSLRCS